jgi:hypothetical protein
MPFVRALFVQSYIIQILAEYILHKNDFLNMYM